VVQAELLAVLAAQAHLTQALLLQTAVNQARRLLLIQH
jgi:hypothetical protein